MLEIKDNIKTVREEIEQNPNTGEKNIRLVAVSKGQNYSAIKAAFDAGQSIFGENYVQEALEKKEFLNSLDILIRKIVRLNSVQQSLILFHFLRQILDIPQFL